ncbi:MAG: FCD domain-containing protein, partial [Solirubrobacteraceae bacterium]
ITIEEAIEVVEARIALESLAAGYAAVRRTDGEARELFALITEMQDLQASGEFLEMSARNGVLHRRVLEISRHHVAIEICGRLHSQLVRFQFRTVLAPGRPARSVAEHRAVVSAISEGDRDEAEAAMQTHLSHVADVLLDIARRERQAS